MSRVRSADTGPELVVRRIVHAMGYRYRLHNDKLPGRPDLVFAGRQSVIFVHGCFWHQHGCAQYRMPRTRKSFWEPKLEKNVKRDNEVHSALRAMGWRVLIIWECETKDTVLLKKHIRKFLK
ncbi:MAG: very short patch repair endonuclease [Nitrospirota bacterium]|nr:very short patch repair endonuclease [Nitrospirota bacterium]